MADDNSDARLATLVKLALPGGTLLGAISAGVAVGAGPAILVLAGGMLAGSIALVWSSLRSLGEGDGEQVQGPWRHTAVATIGDEAKIALLRTLKDLEHEHEVGKLSTPDYQELSAKCRDDLKAVLREIDRTITPHIKEAEALAKAHLATSLPTTKTPARRSCGSCDQSNEPDALFCKKCGHKLGEEGGDDASA